MNITSNIFRKCAYCLHNNQKNRCCCQKPYQAHKKNKKSKETKKNTINQSLIPFVDQNYPKYPQNRPTYVQYNIKRPQFSVSTILTQNQILKKQNINLKTDLLSISHLYNDERNNYKNNYNLSTKQTLKTQSQQAMSDRLYISNKNLQQAVLKIDYLSRLNKQLNDKNLILSSTIQSLKIQNQELNEDLRIIKKELKRTQISLNQFSEKNNWKQEYKNLKQKYENMKIQSSNLIQEIQKLKNNLENKNNKDSDNMSPAWVAETSNKISYIEEKIDFAERKMKSQVVQKQHMNQKSSRKLNSSQNMINSNYFQIMYNIKKDLALSINTLHTKTRKFDSVFDRVGDVGNENMTNLICTLIQGFVQSCINLNMSLQKQLKRKVRDLEKRLQGLLGKVQIFLMQTRNKQLRERQTNRSRRSVILLSNSNNKQRYRSKSKSPCLKKQGKQNYFVQQN